MGMKCPHALQSPNDAPCDLRRGRFDLTRRRLPPDVSESDGRLSPTSVSNSLRRAVWRVATSRCKITIAAGPLTRAGTPAAYSPVSSDHTVHAAALAKTSQ